MRIVECKNRWKREDGREGNIGVQAAPDSAMRFPFRWTRPNLSCDSVHRRYFLSIKYQSNQTLIRTPRHCPDFCVSHGSIFTSDSHHQFSSPRTVSHCKTPHLHTHSTTTTALSPQTSQPVIAVSSLDCRLLCSPCHRLPSIAMTTPHTTLDDTGQADSSEDTQEMQDTQEHAGAQPGQSEGEAEVRIL